MTTPGAHHVPTVVWAPEYEVDLGPHVFVTAKYRLARERLLNEGTLADAHFVAPAPATREQLARAHTEEYLDKVERDALSMSERWRLEVPLTEELRNAMTLSCGGTLLAARRALTDGVAVHLGGGFHHAYAGHGEGFCLYNDVPVAVRALQAEGLVATAAVVDLDVHHGNGTASILGGDETVFTFSMHQEHNYPAEKPPSTLDIGLDDGVGDEEYLERLQEALPEVLGPERPDIVFYLAGADPYREDQLGGLRLTLDGLRRRDRTVLEACTERSVPVVVLMAGGYAVRLEDTVAIHVATVEEAVRATPQTPRKL